MKRVFSKANGETAEEGETTPSSIVFIIGKKRILSPANLQTELS